MANLDTRSKRASSVQILAPYNLALVLPDGTIASADMQHIAWTYSGIAAISLAVVPAERTYALWQETRTFTVEQETRTVVVGQETRIYPVE